MNKPKLVIMIGISASGKSTMSFVTQRISQLSHVELSLMQ